MDGVVDWLNSRGRVGGRCERSERIPSRVNLSFRSAVIVGWRQIETRYVSPMRLGAIRRCLFLRRSDQFTQEGAVKHASGDTRMPSSSSREGEGTERRRHTHVPVGPSSTTLTLVASAISSCCWSAAFPAFVCGVWLSIDRSKRAYVASEIHTHFRCWDPNGPERSAGSGDSGRRPQTN